MIITAVYIGLISAVLSEIFKLHPAIGQSKATKRILAFVVTLATVAAYVLVEGKTEDLTSFILLTLGTTFLSYKAVIQPLRTAGRITLGRISNKEE